MKKPLIFHSGKGEWYNQPHDKLWDMGEDAAKIPNARWHEELIQTIAEDAGKSSQVVVDLSEMYWLVGQDWGFLVQVSDDLAKNGAELIIVAVEKVAVSAKLLELDKRFTIVGSLTDAP